MPPKTGATITEGGTRTRSSGKNLTDSNAVSQWSRDEVDAATASESEIHGEREAMEWMIKGIYLVKGESVTPKRLAHAMLQMAVAIPKLTRQGINALRATAFVLEGIDAEQEGKAIGEAVSANVQKVLKDYIAPTIREIKNTTKEIAEKGQKFVEATETLTKKIADVNFDNGSNEDTRAIGKTIGDIQVQTEKAIKLLQEEKEQRQTRKSYADSVSNNAVPNYEQAAIVAKGNLLDRQVVVRKAVGAGTDQLASLTERELVEKARIALELMGIRAEDRPKNMKFMGARRTQSGAIVYTLDAPESASYLRKGDVMSSFMEHYGGTSNLHARAYQMVVEHAPVGFDTSSTEARKKIEADSGLPTMTVYETRWIKPVHLRSTGQKVAFMIMGFASREAANHAIDYGVVIEGKHCRTRKLLPEPRRCVKCQEYGHFARECKATKDTCARCAGDHRTADEECQVSQGHPMKCANCQREGHGAADRGCEVYKKKLNQLRNRDPDSKFRLFPTEDPRTWGKAGDAAPMDEFDGAWRKERQKENTENGPLTRGGASGRGRGGIGARFGGRGGARKGRTGAHPTQQRTQGQTSQTPTGYMHQKTLAEIWTGNGGRMGEFNTQKSTKQGTANRGTERRPQMGTIHARIDEDTPPEDAELEYGDNEETEYEHNYNNNNNIEYEAQLNQWSNQTEP